MSVALIKCPSDAAVCEEYARWRAAGLNVKRPALSEEDGQYEAVLLDPVGRTTAIAYCPLAEDEAPGSAVRTPGSKA